VRRSALESKSLIFDKEILWSDQMHCFSLQLDR